MGSKSNLAGFSSYAYCAGFIGFVLGGPLSALLAVVSLQLLSRGLLGNRNKFSPLWGDILIVFLLWFGIGLVAMPVSWFITRSMGWNLDLVALVQSGARFKSYKDWSAFEEQQAKAEEEKQNAIRQQRNLERKRLQAEEDRKWEEQKRAEAAAEKAEEDRKRAEEEKESAAWYKDRNDPIKQQQREEESRRVMQSLGCIDEQGRIRQSLVCMNIER